MQRATTIVVVLKTGLSVESILASYVPDKGSFYIVVILCARQHPPREVCMTCLQVVSDHICFTCVLDHNMILLHLHEGIQRSYYVQLSGGDSLHVWSRASLPIQHAVS